MLENADEMLEKYRREGSTEHIEATLNIKKIHACQIIKKFPTSLKPLQLKVAKCLRNFLV